MESTPVKNATTGVWEHYDSNHALLHDADASNDASFAENWEGPLKARYYDANGMLQFATVLYDGLPYWEHTAQLDANGQAVGALENGRTYQLSVQLNDNSVVGTLKGYTQLTFTHVATSDTGVVETVPSPAAQDFWIDYETETVTLFVNDSGVEVHLANTSQDLTGTTIRNGDSLTPYIKTEGEERTVLYLYITDEITGIGNSTVPTPIYVPARPAAPAGVVGIGPSVEGASDGSLAGVTADMEYRKAGESTWTSITEDGNVDNLPAGDYEVRYRVVVPDGTPRWDAAAQQMEGYKFASEVAVVVIPEAAGSEVPTSGGGDETGESSDSSTTTDTNTGNSSTTVAEARQSIYRLYNPNSGLHHYTTDTHEVSVLTSLGWNDEGVAFVVHAESGSGEPTYRAYNPNNGTHNWTMDLNEQDTLVGLGWNDEGMAWRIPVNATQDVYRLYNPNSAEHLYTTDEHEYQTLMSLGWNGEGVGWRSF